MLIMLIHCTILLQVYLWGYSAYREWWISWLWVHLILSHMISEWTIFWCWRQTLVCFLWWWDINTKSSTNNNHNVNNYNIASIRYSDVIYQCCKDVFLFQNLLSPNIYVIINKNRVITQSMSIYYNPGSPQHSKQFIYVVLV